MTAVLDTNVLLGDKRRQLLLLASVGAYTLVSSHYILDEVRRKMRDLGWGKVSADALIQAILLVAEVVDHRMITGGNYDEWLRDPDDHPIMATALAGAVDYIVTQDTQHFPPKKRFADITILTPDALVRVLQSRTGQEDS